MRFAARSDFGEAATPFGEALQQARQRAEYIDLTLSNPTRCGFDYSAIDLTRLSTAATLRYAADPFGSREARSAVATLYTNADPERILLTASTSEAYGYLLRLLCEPGDQVLVPSPSYPLFDLLARLHDVELVSYPLVYHDGWQVDPVSLEAAVTPRTRAIVLIHPNNPTGHYSSAQDRETLYALARRHELPLIVDEVFLEYALEGAGASFADEEASVLTFVLGGLSKSLAMPQMKLAWTVVCGPSGVVAQAIQRLEVIADTFLSVSTPVQAALPEWLPQRSRIQDQVLTRLRQNLRALDVLLEGTPISRLKMEGGWSVVLRVPAWEDDATFAVQLLEALAVGVHPGSFYGFPPRGWLVLSLLPEPAAFRDGVQRLLNAFQQSITATS